MSKELYPHYENLKLTQENYEKDKSVNVSNPGYPEYLIISNEGQQSTARQILAEFNSLLAELALKNPAPDGEGCREAFEKCVKETYNITACYHPKHKYGAFQEQWIGFQAARASTLKAAEPEGELAYILTTPKLEDIMRKEITFELDSTIDKHKLIKNLAVAIRQYFVSALPTTLKAAAGEEV